MLCHGILFSVSLSVKPDAESTALAAEPRSLSPIGPAAGWWRMLCHGILFSVSLSVKPDAASTALAASYALAASTALAAPNPSAVQVVLLVGLIKRVQ